jgi:uncharacterized membrane protein
VIHPRLLLWAATGAFAAGFSALAVLRHRSFATGRFDLGNMTQAVWSTADGRFLEITDLSGTQISRLGAHFDPILAAFAPLWWLWPDPSLLLVAQAVAVALGAPAVYRLACKHLHSERAGLAFGLAYLLFPPVQWLVVDDFHPVALATPLLLWAFWFADDDRLWPFVGVAAVACLTKEHIGLVVAALGLWYALARGRRMAGFSVAAVGAVVAVLAIAVIVPHYAPGGGSPFAGRYEAVGGTPGGIVETAVTDPARIASETTTGRDLRYLGELLWPLAGLSLLGPAAALTAAPELTANLLSSTRTQTSIHFHYTAGAIPGLMAGAVLGAAWLARRRPGAKGWIVAGVVGIGILANFRLAPVPLWRFVPGGQSLGAREAEITGHDRVAARALKLIPPDAAVSATNTLGAHLSERRRVLSFPRVAGVDWIAADEARPSYLDRVSAPELNAAALRRLRADRRWRLLHSEDGVLVFRRTS